MRVINILIALIVLVCNIVVSYNHSIELFQSGGFKGWMAHVAVIGCELTFILGALNLVVSRFKNDSAGVPAIMGGLLGVGLVSWSNVAAGWSYGVTGILLGLATPLSLIIAEAILSRAIMQNSKTDDEIPVAKRVEHEEHEEPQTSQADLEKSHKMHAEKKTPLEVATDYYESNGELPTIAQLEELADTSTWKARKALTELRPQFENGLKPAELQLVRAKTKTT